MRARVPALPVFPVVVLFSCFELLRLSSGETDGSKSAIEKSLFIAVLASTPGSVPFA